ncbi:hypothetical protein BV96_02161 [Sphingomonas paucimobilis]|nr:hypothetical protein BV96_02161 [Sphingomonas paucimobilis]
MIAALVALALLLPLFGASLLALLLIDRVISRTGRRPNAQQN